MNHFQLNSNNPEVEKAKAKEAAAQKDEFIGDTRFKETIKETVNERDPNIDDFYAKRDLYEVDALDKKEYEAFQSKLSEEDKKLLNSNLHFYELKFKNIGGLLMPLIIRATFADGTEQVIRIPAEIWRKDEVNVSKVFPFEKEVVAFRLDPFLETADTDLGNNSWPSQVAPTRFELFKQQAPKENPMQRQKRVEELGK